MQKITITQGDFMNSKISNSDKALVIPYYSAYYQAFLIDVNAPPSKLTSLVNSLDYPTLSGMLISVPHWFDRFWLRYLALTIKHKLGRPAEYPYMNSLKMDRKGMILQEVENIKLIYRLASLNDILDKNDVTIRKCRTQVIKEMKCNRKTIYKRVKAYRLIEASSMKYDKKMKARRAKEEIQHVKNQTRRDRLFKAGKLWVQFNVNSWVKRRGQYYHNGYQTIIGILEKENPASIWVKVNGGESQLFKSYVEYKELHNYRVKKNEVQTIKN